jgi:hypothetical protein
VGGDSVALMRRHLAATASAIAARTTPRAGAR